ncbi:hypothetical protein ACJJV6_18320 [Arthrobacter nitrophenolicus]|uniref:Uncharacterized protein n=1 Tax=Arthrobacter nitrophenolicus TaxID=683150 RepID=A0ACC6TED2_9MICC|nr:hypothetical protein [Arthrobacter nitrophenolicus]
MNLGSMIRNAAGRFTGRTGTSGTVRGTGMNAARRTPHATGGRTGGMAHKIMGMLRRH